MSNEPAAALLDEGHDLGEEVPLREIDRRLRQLWEGADARTRASAMNFAVISSQSGSLAANTGIVRSVTREHACRALLLCADPSSAEPSRAWITAHCQLAPGGKKMVCSEQVAIAIPGGDPLALTNTLLANLDSDLPLTLWWQGEFSANWTAPLFTCIDRLVVDSSEWKDPRSQFAVLEQAWRDPASAFSVNDLTWTRVLSLRLALASAFDEPAALAALSGVISVEIDCARGHRLAGSMFASWMMHRAGWKLGEAHGGGCFTLTDASGRRITLELAETRGECPVLRCVLRSPSGTVTLDHEAGASFIVSRMGDDDSPRLTPCPGMSPAELIIERLRRGCNTKLYFSLLETVLRLYEE